MVKEAVQLGLAKHMGTDYWKSPAERIERIRNPNEAVLVQAGLK